jgi:phosphate ABC transporter phosphate-binding protein
MPHCPSISAWCTRVAQDVTGAGASFPAPIYAKWADAYNKATGARINYQSVGSGAGIRQIKAKTVDFGASDAPLKDDELAKDGLVQFPTVIGGVVPVVNIKGITPGQIKLTGQVLGDIYLGKITKWNDAAITGLNPGVPLPDAAIAVVRRADGSGTSFLFTNYLSKVNPEWKAKVGEGTAVNWPTGAGGKGNEGRVGLRAAPAQLDRLRRVRLRQAEQDEPRAAEEPGRQLRRPDDTTFKAAAAGADWAKLLPGADRAAGQGQLADHRRHLHPDAQDAGQAGLGHQRAEVLRLGLRQRRQDGRRPGLRAAAGVGEGPGAQAVGRQIKDARARPSPSSDLTPVGPAGLADRPAGGPVAATLPATPYEPPSAWSVAPAPQGRPPPRRRVAPWADGCSPS